MTTYAEKADIAAKAVKVLDSVTMSRHKRSAERYAQLADRAADDSSYLVGVKVLAPLQSKVRDALKRMKDRLEKPRYTMKDGEWVLKPKRSSVLGRAYTRERHLGCLSSLAALQDRAGVGFRLRVWRSISSQ